MSITKYFVAIGMKNGKVESVKWFLESDSYDRIISEKNAISAYLQEELKYKAKEYGGEYYYMNFNYYGQTVGVVMSSQSSYYNGGFVRLTFYSNKTVSNKIRYDEIIREAHNLRWQKRYDEAKKKYEEAFEIFPDKKRLYQIEYDEKEEFFILRDEVIIDGESETRSDLLTKAAVTAIVAEVAKELMHTSELLTGIKHEEPSKYQEFEEMITEEYNEDEHGEDGPEFPEGPEEPEFPDAPDL
jgi:tetratricopeptide (TPR) repeat protein